MTALCRLSLVAETNSGAAGTASEKVAALLSSAAVPSSGLWINCSYISKTVKQSETSTLELSKTDISLCADNDSLENFVANSAIMPSK